MEIYIYILQKREREKERKREREILQNLSTSLCDVYVSKICFLYYWIPRSYIAPSKPGII